MANVIKHKRGSGSDPSASDLILGELAIRTDTGKLFTKMDSGAIAEIAGGGSDIAINTLSSSSATGGGSATFNGSAYRFTLSAPPNVSAAQLLVSINGVIQKPVAGTGQPSEGFSVDGTDIILGDAPATGSDFFILTFKSLGVSEPADNSVTSAKIVDGAIVNADINASAAIAGTKISPDFGSQNITTTGIVKIADGSVSAPAIAFTDDLDTGIFSVAQNTINFTTSGVERLEIGTSLTVFNDDGADVDFRIEGSGEDNLFKVDAGNDRIGIGTSSPQKLLDVRGEFAISNSNASYWDFDRDDSDGSLKIKDTGTERMRIDSSGRLLIGTTSSRSSAGIQTKLQIEGTDEPTSSLSLIRNTANTNAPRLIFGKTRGSSLGANVVVQDNDVLGNIAFVGNDGTDLASFAANIAAFVDGTPGSNDMPGRLVFSTTADGAASVTERMRIDSSGNVGIGTTSPAQIFHVKNTGSHTTWRIENDNADFLIQAGDAGADGLHFYDMDNTAYRMTIANSGNVGIGTTSPGRTLDVNGIIRSDGTGSALAIGGNSSTPSEGVAIHRPATHTMAFVTDSSERMRIDSGGDVGINESSNINGRLHVQHDALAENILYATRYNQQSTNKPIFAVTEAQMSGFADSGTVIGNHNRSIFIGSVFQDTGVVDTSDTTGLCVRSSGRVGIGTADPNVTLEIKSTTPTIRLSDSDASGTPESEISGGGGDLTFSADRDDENSSTVIDFKTDGTQRMRITSSGIFVPAVHNRTTSASVNMRVDSDGEFRRSTSSKRYKKDITTATWGLAEVLKLKPITYKNNSTEGEIDDKTYAGFTAEDMHDLGLTEFVDYNENNQPDALAYGNMVALMAKAIQDLNAKVEALEAK